MTSETFSGNIRASLAFVAEGLLGLLVCLVVVALGLGISMMGIIARTVAEFFSKRRKP